VLAGGLLSAVALVASCRGAARETYVTYFNGEHGLSLRHPASWHSDQAEQDGVWYRYFLAPPAGDQGRSPVSVTLLAGGVAASVDEYAKRYLAGHTVSASRPEQRQGVSGRSWVFASADGATRYRLLLLANEGRVAGLYAQGDAAAIERAAAVLDEIWSSLTIERPDRYPLRRWRDFDTTIGVPESWRETRTFSGGGTLLVQFASPPLAVERGQTVNAALSITIEPVAEGGGLREYYESTRRKLGDNFMVTSHQAFRGGYVDVIKTETPVAVSFSKRYYFAEGSRGCSLSFEAREDVFPRASRWADYIASTLRLGPAAPAAAPVSLPGVTAATPAAVPTPAGGPR